MKLDTKILSPEVKKILNEDGLSPEELANRAGISTTTVYKILDLQTVSTQRAIARKICYATGRNFRIDNNRIEFYKETKIDETNLTKDERTLLKIWRRSSTDMKEVIYKLLKLNVGADSE